MLLDKISIHSWINSNQIKVESGQDLDFHDHRYLFDPYRDQSPQLVCLKAGQIGFSVMAILKTIWLALYRGLNIGYILPTVDMVQKFVGSKVNAIAQQNPIVGNAMKDKDSITLKQIGSSFIHYLGAQTERSAIMLSLDLLVSDEHDKSPQDILETYNSRLQHSKYGWKWVFSNPTLPDVGVDRFWQMSDQKRWYVNHCGKPFLFDESCVDFQAEIYRCPHCQGEITRENIRMGDWYNKDGIRWTGSIVGSYEWSGWWIPLWINPMISAKRICEYKRNSTREYFYNFVAGLPYVNTNDALSQSKLEKNLSIEVNPRTSRTIIGLDTGHNLHYTMLNKEGIFYHGYCKSVDENRQEGGSLNYDPYDEIDKIMKDDSSAILIADQGGDLIGVRKLQDKYQGRVILCWFTKETKNQEITRWIDEENGIGVSKVLVDRNRMVQLVVDQLNEARATFNGTLEDWQPFFNHCLNIYRVKEMSGEENDPQYGWRWVWKRKGADHWFMSMVYALVGFDKYKEGQAEFIGKSSFKFKVGSAEGGVITGRRIGTPIKQWN